MATGIVITVAEKLYTVLHSEELREICSMFGYESQLDELAITVSTIKCVLLDIESKHQELTHEGRDYIERLKNAVYDVDDLLDEFNTMVQKKKNIKGGKISKKVRQFFSRSNKFMVAFSMSREIKNLRSKLDKIAKDRQQFGFSDVYVPIKRRHETMSFATQDSIIGRETDKEGIVGMLLGDSESSNDVGHKVCYVTIVGMGGLGKTALAQLVFNDSRIKEAFDELRLWVCVSEDFVLEHIFRQMLKKEGSRIEELQSEVRKLIEGKKYLLVLDDAWSESRDEWDKLKSFLDLGRRGSRIVVTSRSKKVARVVGDDLMYELKGLSEENSWNLFKRLAFKQGKEPTNSDDYLFDIGKKIVKKCVNVPLAIRVVGSMLFDQDESKWQSLEKANLMNMGQGEDDIINILKFSYYELNPALKSCFSYCALFPKDYVVKKELLIWLWLVQGYLDQPLRNEEDVGEEYFSILLHRCFLQDIKEDEYGEIISCKMHDLIHDLAQEVAGKETITLDDRVDKFDIKNRHLSFTRGGCILLDSPSSQWSEMKSLRTFLRVGGKPYFDPDSIAPNVIAMCLHLRRLRVLDLHGQSLDTLPDTLGNLSHLRFLDLSWNGKLRVLPNSITKLYNMQVLYLDHTGVQELPRDMRKLVNLRHLTLPYLPSLNHMPAGFDRLTYLHTLTNFVVGDETSNQGNICKLRDLKALVNLRGNLWVDFHNNFSCDVANYQEVELLREMHLKMLAIEFSGDQGGIHETLLAALQPHNKLKEIKINGYQGFKLPTWAESLTTSLSCLVKIHLMEFDRLEILPSLSQLRHLRKLELKGMRNVEFMESDVVVGPSDDQLLFFPSLEELWMTEFTKLKGWWREETRRVIEDAGSSSVVVPSFPRLRELRLMSCPSLTTFPSSPNLTSLELSECHEALSFLGSTTMVPSHLTTGPVLFLKSCEELYIRRCPNIKSVLGVVKHLTGLRILEISYCKNMELENDEKWKSLHLLSFLKLYRLPKLVNLPVGFQYLTSLQSLGIDSCENLEALPEWLNCLTSLQKLTISNCGKLKSLPEAIGHMPSLTHLLIDWCENLRRRCREPDGQDWPKIRRIPRINIL